MNSETSKVNVPLLRKAIEWVESEGAKPLEERVWDQAFWSRNASEEVENIRGFLFEYGDTLGDDAREHHQRQLAIWEARADHCGTTMCVAGYVCDIASPEKVELKDVEATAAALLGLTRPEASRIFFNMSDDPAEIRWIAEEISGERL